MNLINTSDTTMLENQEAEVIQMKSDGTDTADTKASLKALQEFHCCHCKQIKGANPFPLAMYAFGMSNLLLGIYNARLADLDSVAMGQGFVYAGIGQTICGVMAFFNGNTVGAFFGLTFGSWWYSFMVSMWLPTTTWYGPTLAWEGFWYSMVWALFLILNFFIVASKGSQDVCNPLSMALVTICSTSAALWSAFPTSQAARRLAGISCALSGVVGMYIATAVFFSDVYGRELLPLGIRRFNARSSSSKTHDAHHC